MALMGNAAPTTTTTKQQNQASQAPAAVPTTPSATRPSNGGQAPASVGPVAPVPTTTVTNGAGQYTPPPPPPSVVPQVNPIQVGQAAQQQQDMLGWMLKGNFDAGIASLGTDLAAQQNRLGMTGTYLDQLAGFANREYDIGMRGMAQQQGFDAIDRMFGNQSVELRNQIIANLNSMFGLNQQDLNTQIGQIDLKHTQDMGQARSAQVAGGFGMAPGHREFFGQIDQGAEFGRDAARNAAAQRDVGTKNSILGQEISKLGDQNSLAKLNEKAKYYGLTADELRLSLDKALAKNGLDKLLNTDSLMQLGASSDAQAKALFEQLLQQLLGMGIDPTRIAPAQESGNPAKG